jgi:hypothetical protein
MPGRPAGEPTQEIGEFWKFHLAEGDGWVRWKGVVSDADEDVGGRA